MTRNTKKILKKFLYIFLQKIFEFFEVIGSQNDEAKKTSKTNFTCLKLSYKVLN